MSEIDNIIYDLFKNRWHGDDVLSSLDKMQGELYKTLKNQQEGYWSGHTAYHITVDGGFLKDASSSEPNKELTMLGEVFMKNYEENFNE